MVFEAMFKLTLSLMDLVAARFLHGLEYQEDVSHKNNVVQSAAIEVDCL